MARKQLDRLIVPERDPPPVPSRWGTASTAGGNHSEDSDSDSDMLEAPLSPRVIEATKASVRRKLKQQKFLNTPTQPVQFERRSRRGLTIHHQHNSAGDQERTREQVRACLRAHVRTCVCVRCLGAYVALRLLHAYKVCLSVPIQIRCCQCIHCRGTCLPACWTKH